ncbi:E3 ubiquitin-protein ligase RMA3-like [Rhodamnia argentea]|uniref:E3 ubiquitin-protein ligase RMA n=1 Tax=Rhodamnia argentea TaxID=178133 RepID=A0ABM3GZ50_9MYRT|nr:E3 ubiquitin-protein ligase RMA3-like [Rhodamnia argentea]XP_048129636.1 E3 ubiquitin-protein ligase RMA3-like [Rhodamnia argentea]
MAVAGQTVSEATSSLGCDRDAPSKQKLNLLSENRTVDDDADVDGCFDCNICFESASDPVVTLCGHLYCWPCLYRWIDAGSSSGKPGQRHQTCPICKAGISPSTLIPLYGRGSSSSSSECDSKKPDSDIAIPRRPSPGALSLNPSNAYSPSRQQGYSNPSLSRSQLSQEQLIAGLSSNAGMFGEMVYARMFRSSDMSLSNYPPAYSYPGVANSGRRVRRQEMKLDRSFNRLTVFLFCCMVLCLLLL